MKTYLLIGGSCIMLSSSLHAQLDIELSGGYGLDLTPLRVGEYTYVAQANGDWTGNAESATLGFFKGIETQLGANIKSANGMFIHLGGAMNLGEQSLALDYDETNYTNGDKETYTDTYTIGYSLFSAQAGIGFGHKLNDKMSLSITSGLTALLAHNSEWNNTVEYTSTSATGMNSTVEIVWEEKGAMTFGAFGSMKLDYSLSENLSLFFNLSLRSATLLQKSAIVTKYDVDGQDYLSTMSTNDKETNYEAEYSYDPTTSINQDEPSTYLADRYTNAGLSLLLGVRYHLNLAEANGGEPEHKMSFTGYAGYNLPMNGMNLFNSDQTSETNVNRSTKHASFGQGLTYGLNTELSLSGPLSAELGFNYVNGSFEQNNYSFSEFGSIRQEYGYNTQFSGSMIRVMPGARLSGGTDKITIYTRFGLSLGVNGETKELRTYTTDYIDASNSANNTTDINITEYEYTGGMSLGYYTGLGIAYGITENLAVNIDATGIIQSFKPTKRVKTMDSYNGQSQLGSQTTSQLETNFVDSYSESNNTSADPDEPSVSLYDFDHPFSVQMISLGITYKLGK